MRVRVKEVGTGVRPYEVLLQIDTVEGPQDLVLDERSLIGGTIEVGYPIAQHADLRLIELPSETARGTWRVWVKESSLMPDGAHQEAAE